MKSITTNQIVYINLSEAGAYELAMCLKRYVPTGWTQASLGFFMHHFGYLATQAEGGTYVWDMLTEPWGSPMYLELPEGAKVANDLGAQR